VVAGVLRKNWKLKPMRGKRVGEAAQESSLLPTLSPPPFSKKNGSKRGGRSRGKVERYLAAQLSHLKSPN